jgi:hypothetical protein
VVSVVDEALKSVDEKVSFVFEFSFISL